MLQRFIKKTLSHLIPSHTAIETQISEFWLNHSDSRNLHGVWDAFKAFLHGVFISQIENIKRATNSHKKQAAQLVSRLEAEFIAGPADSTRETWTSAQEALDHINTSTVDRKSFFYKLAFYEEGEQTGCLLARIVQSHQASPSIGALHTRNDTVVHSPDQIMTELVVFYSDLYQSKQRYSADFLQNFLDGIELPCLSEAHKRFLDFPITIKELHHVASLFPNSKAPGDDGLPAELY